MSLRRLQYHCRGCMAARVAVVDARNPAVCPNVEIPSHNPTLAEHPPPPKRAPHRRVHRGSANNVATGWPNPLALNASAHLGATLSCATVSCQVRHPLRCDATTPKDPPIAVCTACGPRQDTPVLWKLDDTRENSAVHENTVHRRFGSTGRSTAAKHGRFTRFYASDKLDDPLRPWPDVEGHCGSSPGCEPPSAFGSDPTTEGVGPCSAVQTECGVAGQYCVLAIRRIQWMDSSHWPP
jgi:hypothetical protein